MMNEVVFTFLILLQIKHWYIDFVNQTEAEVAGKGTYLNAVGMWHSIKHGIGTVFVSSLVFGFDYWFFCLVIGFLDFVAHYHIDWAKMNINKKYEYTIENPKFWAWLGADQLAHQLTYIGIVWLTVA